MLRSSYLRLLTTRGRSMLYPRAGYHVKSAPIWVLSGAVSCFPAQSASPPSVHPTARSGTGAYIGGEFAADPDQLGRVGLEFLDPAGVRLPDVHGIAAEGIDGLEVVTEVIRVLVIPLRDVLAGGGC